MHLCSHVLVLVDGRVEFFGPVADAVRSSAYIRDIERGAGGDPSPAR
jgi:hypothetical protein